MVNMCGALMLGKSRLVCKPAIAARMPTRIPVRVKRLARFLRMGSRHFIQWGSKEGCIARI